MDSNLTFTKNWADKMSDDDLWIQIGLDFWGRDMSIYQVFDATIASLQNFGQMLIDKADALQEVMVYEFNSMVSLPPIAFCLNSAKYNGVIPIEIDLELPGSVCLSRTRCKIQIESEPEMLKTFGRSIKKVATGKVGQYCKLNPVLPAVGIVQNEDYFPYIREVGYTTY